MALAGVLVVTDIYDFAQSLSQARKGHANGLRNPLEGVDRHDQLQLTSATSEPLISSPVPSQKLTLF
jgi:hypothetical protein